MLSNRMSNDPSRIILEIARLGMTLSLGYTGFKYFIKAIDRVIMISDLSKTDEQDRSDEPLTGLEVQRAEEIRNRTTEAVVAAMISGVTLFGAYKVGKLMTEGADMDMTACGIGR